MSFQFEGDSTPAGPIIISSGMKDFDLKKTLSELQPGERWALHSPYPVFARDFPPGADDEAAMERARRIAASCDCYLEKRPEGGAFGEVLFIKKGQQA